MQCARALYLIQCHAPFLQDVSPFGRKSGVRYDDVNVFQIAKIGGTNHAELALICYEDMLFGRLQNSTLDRHFITVGATDAQIFMNTCS